MAEVRLTIGGRAHVVACRDGGEATLEALGRRLDSHAAVAARAAGGQGGERTMLYIALMLADELAELEKAPPSAAPVAAAPSAVIERIADRLEQLADTLEQATANP